MPKSQPSIDELIILKMEIDATSELVARSLKDLSERIERLMPDIPVREPVRDWKKEVMSWPSWKRIQS